MQFAAKAVTQTQGNTERAKSLLQREASRAEITPGLPSLIGIESGDIAPGMHGEVACSQLFKQPAVADMGRRLQVATADELHQP